MRRKLSFLFIFFFLAFMPFYVDALSPAEILNRVSECPQIELAEAKEDGSLLKVACYTNYQEAKNAMNTTALDNLVILENRVIIDAKYAVVDYDIDYPTGHKGYMDIYTTSSGSTINGYVNGGTPDEAAMIDVDYNTKRVKIKIAEITGWINKYDGSLKLYDIVPLAWVKTPQYYRVTDSSLIHYYPGNVYGTKGEISYAIDKKPVMLANGTYYSYDGHYFYTSMKSLLQDYKNGNYNQAVNPNQPYYNYYQYVGFRTKTNYTAENIDQYIASRTSDKESKMLSTGNYFINAQNAYGTNAALMMAIGMNESGRGTSWIAKNKNNLFGLNAIDQSPGESANYFASVEDCINEYSYIWLAYGYLDPRDYRYYGANLGNKYQGLNYKYASDPFWAEKAAHYYYDLDSMFGFQDHGSYQVAVLNNDYSNTVYAKKTPGGENVADYQYKQKGSSIVILAEVEGPAINGNTVWYKIQADGMLDGNLNIIGSSKDNPRVTYNWDNNMVYVPAAYFTKLNSTMDPSTPGKPSNKPISSIVTEAGYQYGNGNIYGISPGTSVETIKSNLTNTGGIITITDANGNIKETGNIGTGDKVNITSGIIETLNILIKGDLTGDGLINSADLLRMRQHLLGTRLSGIYEQAAYMEYNTINSANLLKIRQYLLGQTDIAQK